MTDHVFDEAGTKNDIPTDGNKNFLQQVQQQSPSLSARRTLDQEPNHQIWL